MNKSTARKIARLANELSELSVKENVAIIKVFGEKHAEPTVQLKTPQEVDALQKRMVVARLESVCRFSSWIESVEFFALATVLEVRGAGMIVPGEGEHPEQEYVYER